MKVLINDLVAFYLHKIELAEKKLVKSLAKYAEKKIQYEAKFFSKLFGLEYENSRNGSLTWFSDCDVPYIRERITAYKNILDKLEYCSKISYNLIEIDKFHENEFFAFAKENKLPY